MTSQNAKDWFTEKHSVDRSWILGDDPPRDVKTYEAPYNKYCFDLSSNEYEFDGYVEFANGIKCKIKPFDIKAEDYSMDDNPHEHAVELQQPCAACE